MAESAVDGDALRDEVRAKYREVAAQPHAEHHFHTGRKAASILGYEDDVLARMPARAVEWFAGVGNPFSTRPVQAGERAASVGSCRTFDSFIAADLVGE